MQYNGVKCISVVESLKDLVIYLTRCPLSTKYLGDILGDEHHDRSPNRITTRNMSHHKFKKKKGPATRVRKPCKKCHENNDTSLIKKPIVTTFCNDCVGKPHLCLRCFNIIHRITSDDWSFFTQFPYNFLRANIPWFAGAYISGNLLRF